MRRFKYNAGDIVGDNGLKLLERTYKDNNKHWHGTFKCARCGTDFDAVIGNVSSNAIKSCGCLHEDMCRELGKKRFNDLTGQTFGHLTAQYCLPHENCETIFWMCQCDCGNPELVKVSASNLKEGKVVSCGCALSEAIRKDRVIDKLGSKIGLLTLIELLPFDKNNPGVYWKCKCDCGTDCIISGDQLSAGVQSCGCLISKGEHRVREILNNLNVNYETQKRFDSCRNPETNYPLPFDFYLPDVNLVIEYDGEQHYKPSGKGGFFTEERVVQIQERDKYKEEWCNSNGIKIVRIPYTDYDILSEEYLMQLLGENG